jgi:hypothetical protein
MTAIVCARPATIAQEPAVLITCIAAISADEMIIVIPPLADAN